MARFEKGTSGNAKGRPKGQTPGAKIRAAIEKRKDDILQSVIDAAVNGDMQACKMLLDRIVPTLKPQAATIDVPTDGALTERGERIITATLQGRIPPDIGAGLVRALSEQGRLLELHELNERLTRLEKRLEGKP